MRLRIAVPVLFLAVWALPAAADEIVYFANGTSMAIRSHKVDGDMIRVDLGAGAIMAFPISMVERVMLGGRDVFTGPGYRPANQALPGVEGSAAQPVEVTEDTTITGEGSLPARYRSRQAEARARIGQEGYGAAPGAGMRRDSSLPQSRLRRAGAPPSALGDRPLGTEAIGDQVVLSAKPPGVTPQKPAVTSFGRADRPETDPPSTEGGETPAEPPPESESEPPPESN